MRRVRDAKLRELTRNVADWIDTRPGSNDKELRASPEFVELYEHVSSLGLVEKFGVAKTNAAGESVPPDDRDLSLLYVWKLRARLLEHPGGFDELYPTFEESLFASSATWESVAPLLNFEMEDDALELPGAIILRRMTEDESSYLGDDLSLSDIVELHDVHFALSYQREESKGGPIRTGTPDSEADTLLTALRLSAPGAVSYNLVITTLLFPEFGTLFQPGQVATAWSSRPRIYGPKYSLAADHYERLSVLLGKLHQGVQQGAVAHAVRRFNFAYERSRPEDRLIDHWIGLEALFLERRPGGELAYKSAVRMARYLGKNAAEREWIYRAAKRSYTARSDIVHGEPAPAGILNMSVFTEEMLRRAICEAAIAGSPPHLEGLDFATVRAGDA